MGLQTYARTHAPAPPPHTHAHVAPCSALTYVWLLLSSLLGYTYQVALTAALQRARAAPAVALSYLG